MNELITVITTAGPNSLPCHMAAAETWQEWRAIYRTPASYLATQKEQDRGYVQRSTPPFRTREEAKKSARHRSEETRAWVIGYETRTVAATGWEPTA